MATDFNYANTITAATPAVAAEVQDNFDDVLAWVKAYYQQTLDTTTQIEDYAFPLDGSVALTGDLNLGSNKIINLATPTAATDASTKAYVDSVVGGVVPDPTPPGVISMWGGDYLGSPPTGYSLCNGQTLSRATYSVLYAVIGTTYGVGDGSTTFTLPNMQGKFPIGENSSYPANSTGGGSKDAIVVSHSHSDSGHAHSYTDQYRSVGTIVAAGSSYGYNPNLTTTYPSTYTGYANISNAGSSGTNANMPPYIAVNFIMRNGL